MSEHETAETDDVETTSAPMATRRSLVSKGAIAAAVGAAAGIVLNDSASAANNDTVQVGITNTGTNTTIFNGSGGLQANGGSPSKNGAAALYGKSAGGTSASYGVRGSGSGGAIGVYGTSASANVSGVRGYNTSTTGGPGVEGESDKGAGVYGKASATSAAGVFGQTTAAQGRGVYGESTKSDGAGIYGEHKGGSTQSGTGVVGVSSLGTGVSGKGTSADFRANGSGRVLLGAATTAPTPTAAGTIGTIARDGDGMLWYCYASNKWQRLSGAGVAGSFTAVTPFRVYDSRKDAAGKFAGGQNRTISVKDSRNVDTYAVVTADAVPAGATAVVGNVVAIGTTDTGFMSINPGGVTAITAATVNWAPGQNIGNAGTFTLNADRQLEAVFGPGAGCHLSIDITGYYL